MVYTMPTTAQASLTIGITKGCTPRLVAADAGFYSARDEAAPKGRASGRLVCPNALQKAPSADASRRNSGSATARNGGRMRKADQSDQNGDTASIEADTKASLG
jgi:hypothetical protein